MAVNGYRIMESMAIAFTSAPTLDGADPHAATRIRARFNPRWT
jgi:hypothetical protein